MDKVVHFEIPMDDEARAKAFYGEVFAWQLDDVDMGGGATYTTATTTPVDEQTRLPTEPGGINGGMMGRSADIPGPVLTIEVASIDETLTAIEANGGGTIQARTPIPGMGAFAYFRDTEGNVLGLWESVVP
jgi:predicted enzyme related to lactoylglutathione lyase